MAFQSDPGFYKYVARSASSNTLVRWSVALCSSTASRRLNIWGTDNLRILQTAAAALHEWPKINPPGKPPVLLGHLRRGDDLPCLSDKSDALRTHNACPDVSVNTAESRAN